MKSKIKCDFQIPVETLIENEITKFNLSKTNNKEFEKYGFLFLENFVDVSNYKSKNIPEERGMFLYLKNSELVEHREEKQVNGSLSRYNYPDFKDLYNEVKIKVEKIIGKKLYETYYYDRYYFPGQQLRVHTDRESCEISVSIHLSSNLNDDWELGIKTPIIFSRENQNAIINDFGNEVYFNFKPGDAILYKGIERPHWRNPMPGKKRNILRKFFKMKELYYHQIFFHYVLSDGLNAHHAFDQCSLNY